MAEALEQAQSGPINPTQEIIEPDVRQTYLGCRFSDILQCSFRPVSHRILR